MALNPWLESKLKQKLPALRLGAAQPISLIVEVEPGALISAKTGLSPIADVWVGRDAFNMIEVIAPATAISQIERIPGVVMVHKSMVRSILPFGLPPLARLMEQLPRPFTLTLSDPLEGEIRIDDILVPRDKLRPDLALPFSPMRFLQHHGPLGQVEMIPTERSRTVLLDIPTALTGRGVKVAVLDTGSAPQNPQSLGVLGYSTCTTDPQPLDMHGHGSWCINAATGRRARGLFGTVLGVAPEAEQIGIKVLHGAFGFGLSMDIIKGIEKAVDLGAKVISMSLGGNTCQGGCENCPECRLINDLSQKGVIFCIAAANSGPDEWTIGCPGCAAGAITVGSMSMTDHPHPAYWSSRGPSNPENKGKTYEPKPDILGPGGGRAVQGATPDEVIYSGEEGWMKGLYSGVADIAGAMHGTSQATPQVAGLCAILVEKGLNNASEIKAVFSTKGHSKSTEGGWGVAKLSWFS